MELAGEGELTDRVMQIVGHMRIGFIVNMMQEREDFELPRAIESVATRLFRLPLVFPAFEPFPEWEVQIYDNVISGQLLNGASFPSGSAAVALSIPISTSAPSTD